ncbi:MAG TPA: methylated-DNA--[protein]-cysteine S-methyltransferase [Candidatus Fimivicinus intestinavium]|nr:methylated-DNA--[protein]-cysteine S-methyltransferase [Candidatus Fimivicinus intestinavium]
MPAQAAGNAVGRNGVSIIVPCHRMAGANKSLTGYAGGIDKTMTFLKWEGACVRAHILPPSTARRRKRNGQSERRMLYDLHNTPSYPGRQRFAC